MRLRRHAVRVHARRRRPHHQCDWYVMSPAPPPKSRPDRAAQGRCHDAEFYTANPGGVCWLVHVPVGLQRLASMDGVVILYSSLPNGSSAPYDEGDTGTHESATGSGCITPSRAPARQERQCRRYPPNAPPPTVAQLRKLLPARWRRRRSTISWIYGRLTPACSSSPAARPRAWIA